MLLVAGLIGVVVGVLGTLAVPRVVGVFAGPEWSRLADLPVAVDAAGVAAFDGRLWVVGGVSPEEGRPLLDDVNAYDPGSGRWSPGPSLPTPTGYASLVAGGDSLYLVGGLTSGGSVPTVLRLASGSREWVEAAPLPEPRGAGAAAWDGSRLVYAGGVRRDHRAADDVWALEGDAWRPIGKLQAPRERLTAISDGYGQVWFVAGRDPALDKQESGAVDLVQPTGVHPLGASVTPVHAAAGVWWPDAGPCVIGGQVPDGFLTRVECLQKQGRVAELPPLGTPRAGLGAAILGRTCYLVGGYGPGSNGTNVVEAFTLPER
jgi:hypothetical protein